MIVPSCPEALVDSVPLPKCSEHTRVVFGATPEYQHHPLCSTDNAIFASQAQPVLFRDCSVDVILCLDPAGQETGGVDSAEFQRILKPDGTLAVVCCGMDDRHDLVGSLNQLTQDGGEPLFPSRLAMVDSLFERTVFEHAQTGRLPFMYTVLGETFWSAVRSHFTRSIADSVVRKRVLQRALRIVQRSLRLGAASGTVAIPCFLDYYLFRPRTIRMLG